MLMITPYAEQKKRHRYIEQSFRLWEKVRVGCPERTALKKLYYQGWNRSPAQVGCMRRVLRAGTLGRPRGMIWRRRREGGSSRTPAANSPGRSPPDVCCFPAYSSLLRERGPKKCIRQFWSGRCKPCLYLFTFSSETNRFFSFWKRNVLSVLLRILL